MFQRLRGRAGPQGDEARPQTHRRPPPTDLVIVIISWNVWDYLRACLASIEQQSTPIGEGRAEEAKRKVASLSSTPVRRFGPDKEATLQVVVLDNASEDATPSLLPSRFPWVQTIFSDENLGFTGGNNRALEAMGFDPRPPQDGEGETPNQTGAAGPATELRTSDGNLATDPSPRPAAKARFIYFLNPDTELLPGSLWALYNGINEDETIGAIGPQLRYTDGALQSSRRRFPGLLTGFFESTWLEQMWPRNPWTRSYHLADWPADARQDVDWLVGAALVVRGEVLAALGGFDPQFFMYSEETDLCRRIRRAGWRVVYDPGAIVIHAEGRSSGQVSARRHILFNRSKVRYIRKWHAPVWAALLRRYLLLEFRLQIIGESFKALLGHKRALRRDRVAAYRDVLKSGLE
ncbi:MAG: glycosyltransferase family 2 protein [Caldilineaceae bacterium]|nr:glycosyltransferase family 2 protein [Caldilineaceae bacterium]